MYTGDSVAEVCTQISFSGTKCNSVGKFRAEVIVWDLIKLANDVVVQIRFDDYKAEIFLMKNKLNY